MALALKGYEGNVTINTGSGAQTMGKVTKWNAQVDFAETETGPYIGSDGTKEVQTTSKSLKGKLECDIPIGRDSAQTALITQALAGGTFDLALVEDDGYTVTCATAKVSSFALDNAPPSPALLSIRTATPAGMRIVRLPTPLRTFACT